MNKIENEPQIKYFAGVSRLKTDIDFTNESATEVTISFIVDDRTQGSLGNSNMDEVVQTFFRDIGMFLSENNAKIHPKPEPNFKFYDGMREVFWNLTEEDFKKKS